MKCLPDKKSRERVAVISVVLLCAVVAMAVLAPVALAQKVSFKLAPGSPLGAVSGPIAVAVGDFNEDRIPDIVVANVNNNTISVFLGNPDGTYSQAPHSPIAVNTCLADPLCNGVPISIAVGKFNLKNNQYLGIAVTNIPINLSCLASAKAQNLPAQDVCSGVAILSGNGDGTFSGSNLPFYSNNFDTGGHLPTSVAVGDFNNDGYPDLAIANLDSGTVSILMGKGDGSFNSPSTISVGSRPTSVGVGDFNGDQVLDLAVANGDDGTVTILTGKRDGTFPTSATFSVGNRPTSIAAGDLNGDGILDLVVANSTDSTVSFLQGKGNGTFQPAKNFGVGGFPTSVGIGNFKGAGQPGIAVVNRLSDLVTILLADGSGSFVAGNHISVGSNPFSVAITDFNHDGFDDLVVANLSSNTASVLLNNSDTTPPVSTATAAPGPNGNGWNNTSVAVTLTSTDSEPNGTGVKEIHYTIGSAAPVVVPGASATVNFTTEGIFTLSYFAV